MTNRLSRRSSAYVPAMPANRSGRRCDGGSVSGNASAATSSSTPAHTTSAAKTQCHDPCSSTAAPSDGATTGATPSTSISRDSTVAAALSANRSPTTAIATTMAAAAPTPCRTRASPSTTRPGASMQRIDAAMCSTMPAIRGRLRPSESDSGPTINWPSANPANVPVRVSCTTDDDTERSSAILGRAGRYMSIVSGPSATMTPSTTIIRVRLGALTSTAGDVAMQLVSTLNQYFLPEPPEVTGITDLSTPRCGGGGHHQPRSVVEQRLA